MIGYVTLGTNDLAKTSAFYDALLGELGAKRALQNDRMVAWGTGRGQPMLCAVKPFDGKPASAGNGTMVALFVDSHEKVDKMYAKAIELGAKDEGKPGARGDGGFYGGYFRDLDGNKLVFFNM